MAFEALDPDAPDRSPAVSRPDPPSGDPVPSIVASVTPNVPVFSGGTYGSSQQITSLFPPSPVAEKPTDDDADAIRKEEGFLEAKIGTDRLAQRNYEDREERYRARQEQAATAAAFEAGDLKPWNAQEALAATKHNLWEQFGSPGFIFAMLASSFTAYPMMSALNGGAAAMNAINQGDIDAYNTAFDAWKENSRLVIDRHKIEQDYFNDIEDLRKHNLEDWKTETAIGLAKFNDQRSLMLLHMGMFPELEEARLGKAKAIVEMQKAKEAIEENETQRQIVMHTIRDDNGKLREEYLDHPERIAEVMGFAKRAMTAPTNAEEALVNGTLLSPDFLKLSNEDRAKRLADALRPIYEAKAAGRTAGLTATDAANVTKRAGEIMQEMAGKGTPVSEGVAYNMAREELEKTKASSRGSLLKPQIEQAVLERANKIYEDAQEKGEPIDRATSLARAQAEYKKQAAGALQTTPDGDTLPPADIAQAQWDAWADQYRQTGKPPSLGLGGSQIKAGLTAHAYYRESKAGGDTGTMQARWAISKGLEKSLSGFEVQDAAVEAFSRNAELNSAVLLQLADKVDKTGVRVFERWQRWSKGQYKGDADVTNFNAQVVTWRNEIAKIVTNPNLNGQLTVHAMEESKSYAGDDWTRDQIRGTVNLFRGDAERRKQSINEQKQKLAYQIAHLLQELPGKEEIPAVSTPTWLSVDDQKAAAWLALNPNDKNAETVRSHLKKVLEGVP